MGVYRAQIVIVTDILDVAQDNTSNDDGASVTHLIRNANISHGRLSKILKNHHVDSYQLDAEIILSNLMGVSREFLITNNQINIEKTNDHLSPAVKRIVAENIKKAIIENELHN